MFLGHPESQAKKSYRNPPTILHVGLLVGGQNPLKKNQKWHHILDQIIKYNNINSDLQIENIVKTLDIIKNKSDPNLYNKIIKNQTQKALEWCKFYDLDINHKSDFLK